MVDAPVRMAVCEDEEPDEGFEVEFEEKDTGVAVMVENIANFAAVREVKSVESIEMFAGRLRG